MTDADNSDDGFYANESFENESDTEVPDISEFESESTGNSDDDREDFPSGKLNTGPIKKMSYPNNFTSINNSNVIPYTSSSDEEDDVIVGQTLAEINTPSMRFEGEPPTPATSNFKPLLNENDNLFKSAGGETRASSEEISEEEDIEEEELKRIKEIEEKYLQQILAKSARKANIQQTETLEENKQENIQESSENITESETDEEQEIDDENLSNSKKRKCIDLLPDKKEICDNNDNISKSSSSSEPQRKLKDNTTESVEQTKLLQIIKKSLTNLQIASTSDNEVDLLKMCQDPLLNENIEQANNPTNMSSPDKIALAIVNALKSAGLTNLDSKEKPKMVEQIQEITQEMKETDDDTEDSEDVDDADDAEQPENVSNTDETNKTETVPFEGNLEEGRKVELEEIQHNNSYYEERDFCCDDQLVYHITSRTPTSFNSDDHIFHANFIKHRTNSTDQMRAKPYPRKSMSFSNERMREIERHNQILLRKILTQKPTYVGKSKQLQSSSLKLPSMNNTRLTNSAVNRKKQQRQITIDNQVLKRKIEAISLRRRPLIS